MLCDIFIVLIQRMKTLIANCLGWVWLGVHEPQERIKW